MASIPPDSALKKGHVRNTPSVDERRVAVPRRRTKGPLDFEENPPLKAIESISSPTTAPSTPLTAALTTSLPMSPQEASAISRDFTYLRHPQNFHNLPSQTLPAPFRTSQPPSSTPLETLISTGHFRAAAITAANTLIDTTKPLSPEEIFNLWYIRLSSLTLIGSTPTAAQEIKVLSDLSSNFYRDTTTSACLLPWELRVLAVRLQAIGFNDWRRSIGLYYELAREARAAILQADATAEQRGTWRRRLRDLGLRVGSALVEMGDLAAASRHLEGLRVEEVVDSGGEGTRVGVDIRTALCLLYIRIGNLTAARECLDGDENDQVLQALFQMAEGKWDAAVEAWKEVVEKEPGEMQTSNLAVCLLYTGKLEEARKVLEAQIDGKIAFPGLTFNLSTIYELCSDNSKALKMTLAERVAGMGKEMVGSSFKM